MMKRLSIHVRLVLAMSLLGALLCLIGGVGLAGSA